MIEGEEEEEKPKPADSPPSEDDPPEQPEPDPDTQPLPAPEKPAPHELPDILLMGGTAETLDDAGVTEAFSENTLEFIRTARAGFAIRLHGRGVHRDFIDAVVFASVIEPVARASRWIGGSVTGHGGVDPGINAAFAGASIIVHFTMAEEEEPEQVKKGLQIAPTVGAGRYLAGLTNVARDEKRLLEGVEPLGTWGVNRYADTLEQLSDNGLGIDWLTRNEEYVQATAGDAFTGYRVLDSVPPTTTRQFSQYGYLEAAAARSRRFRLETKDGAVAGHFLPSAEDSLDGAWNHNVRATIEAEEALHPNLPRAPRPRYRLIEITHIEPKRRPDPRG